MKSVATYSDPFEAHLAKGVLENEGIMSEVVNESSPFPGLGGINGYGVKLMVNDEDSDSALKILAASSSKE